MPPDMLSSAPLHGPSPGLRVGDFFVRWVQPIFVTKG